MDTLPHPLSPLENPSWRAFKMVPGQIWGFKQKAKKPKRECWASRGLARQQRRRWRRTLESPEEVAAALSQPCMIPEKQDQILSTPKDAHVLSKLDSHHLVSHWSPYWEFSIQSIPSSPILKISGLFITKEKHLMTADISFVLNTTLVLSFNVLRVYRILVASRPATFGKQMIGTQIFSQLTSYWQEAVTDSFSCC